MCYFELADPESLRVDDPMLLFRHSDVQGEWADDGRIKFIEQVTAIVEPGPIHLDRPVAGMGIRRDLKYPELTETAQHKYEHIWMPEGNGRLSRIIVQTRERVASPFGMYEWANAMASELAYEADSAIQISEWQWFSIRPGTISVRRDFRATYSEEVRKPWRELQRSLHNRQHVRGNTLWMRANAHYHEGLRLHLPIYQFLAYYKGCEALVALRNRLGTSGYVFDKCTLHLPDPLASEFPDLHDQAVQKAIDALYKPFRNLAAHYEAKNREEKQLFIHSGLFADGLVAYAKLSAVCKQCFRTLATSLINARPPRRYPPRL